MSFKYLFEQFKNINVAVLGDVMLDSYMWGHVNRISPEAPVPIVSITKKEYRMGGAGNVALNLVALGANTSIISIIGNDEDGKQLKKMFENYNIQTSLLLNSSERITTNKTRIIGRNQQMMRLDTEITKDISAADEQHLINSVETFLKNTKLDVLIFEDYNKGVLTENIITAIIALCKQYNVITTVDPKHKNFFSFKGVDIFKPNLKEVKEGLNVFLDEVNITNLQQIHASLKEKLQHEISLITLSEYGVFFQSSSQNKIIPTHIRNIADVSGAGDTVIAVASLVYAATKQIALAAEIANIAGGLVCEEVGTAAINSEKLLAECELLLHE
ncbi:MAG: carbohydrate kinase [Bacteroidetes bacterium]|nr:carbohydrate kinase [Bacteroidota bacterium]MBS1648237.1 carbohydrate kinase [Bacteroidota bacterium]